MNTNAVSPHPVFGLQQEHLDETGATPLLLEQSSRPSNLGDISPSPFLGYDWVKRRLL